MSHELEIIDGRALFLGKKDAWHRLGTVVGDAFGETKIQEHAPELLMDVELIVPHVLTPNGISPLVKTAAVVRSDGKIVGEGVGQDSYGIVQAREAFEFGQQLAGAFGDKPLVSAGSIREGTQFFFCYEVDSREVGGERINSHFSVISSHDMTLALQGLKSTVVPVCANTVAMALESAVDRILLKHTSKVDERMAQILAARELVEEHTEAVVRRIATLQATQVRNFDLVVDGVLPKMDGKGRGVTMRTDQRKQLRELYFDSELVAPWRGTGWGALQAVNSFEQWVAPVRGKAKGQSDEQLRAVRQFDAMVKGVQPLTAKATELILAGV